VKGALLSAFRRQFQLCSVLHAHVEALRLKVVNAADLIRTYAVCRVAVVVTVVIAEAAVIFFQM
jgi:hypothetical protein